MQSLLAIEQRDRVLIARIQNPPHQLMTAELLDELEALVQRASTDPGVGAVVLTGSDPNRFIAHYSIGELLEVANASPAVGEKLAALSLKLVGALAKIPGMDRLLSKTPADGVMKLHKFHRIMGDIGRSGAVFIAAINGETAGGGMELSLACDLRYISDQGQMGQFEILLGFPPGGGGTQRLSRLVGDARALEIVLDGRALSPEEAKRMGVVNDVFPHEALLDHVLPIAERLAHRPKTCVAGSKRIVLQGGSLPLNKGLAAENAAFMAMLGGDDSKRAMQAYVDHIDRTGEIPIYDPETRRKLDDGSFIPFHDN